MLERFGSMVQAQPGPPPPQLGPLGQPGMQAVAVAELPPMGAPAAPLSAPPPVAFRQAANNNVGEGTISVKQESNLLEGVCASCGRTILDRYVMRVNERDYHEACLSCCECSQPLSRSCYTRDCKFYCWADYERIYAVKCARCQQRIDCNEMVMRTPPPPSSQPQLLQPGLHLQQQQQQQQQQTGLTILGSGGRLDGPVFHVDCFVCCVCGEPLRRGALYKLKHGQPLCKREFQSDMYNINSPQDDDMMDDNRPRDGRRGPKRPRTILTSVQRRQFKASFEISPKPCRKVREALAKDTGLSVRVVQVWFQNQRAKMKKLQRKAKTESGSDKEPKEDRKTESPHRDHTHVYLDALNMRDGESSNFPSATQPLNPNNPYSPDDAYPGHSCESFCSSDDSIDGTEAGFELGEADGSSGGGIAPSTGSTGQDVGGTPQAQQQHLHPHHAHQSQQQQQQQPPNDALSQLHSQAVMHNPIDKLYLMQNSYFSVDHP